LKTTGTVIGRIPLTETSLIVEWCSHDYGIIKTVAKGARRHKSPFAGKLDLFFRCELEIHPARSGDLHILKEIAIINSRFGVRRSYLQTLAASYFVKLIEKAVEPGTPIPEFEDLLNRALDFLDKNEATLNAVLHFEKQMIAILGMDVDANDLVFALGSQLSGGLAKHRDEVIKRLVAA
jgi:DNA repair protein RecO (recombination protein O)